MWLFVQKLRLLRAILILSADHTKTNQVFAIIDAILRSLPKQERQRICRVLLDHPGFSELYKKPPPLERYDLVELMTLPQNTLGHAYALHMRTHGLDPEFYPHFAVTDPIQFARVRLSQTHDVLHTVTGFGVSKFGEFGLQAFYLQQLPSASFSVAILASAFLGVLSSRKFEERSQLLECISAGYNLGKRAKPILFRKWEDDWSTDLNTLRHELGLETPKNLG